MLCRAVLSGRGSAVTEIVFAYIAVPDRHVAEKLGLLLVESRVVACVNIIPGMETIYRWKGKVERHGEIVVIAKTTRERFPDLTAIVRQHHPYQVPCIVALPIVAGDPTYMRWVEENSGRPQIV